MMEEIDKGMDQLKEQYIEPYVNQRRPSKGEQCLVDVNRRPYMVNEYIQNNKVRIWTAILQPVYVLELKSRSFERWFKAI